MRMIRSGPDTRRESFREEAIMTTAHSVLSVSFGSKVRRRPLSIATDSAFHNQPMGKTCVHTRCGVSIVGIMREGEVLPSPGTSRVLHTGDVLVAVGTQEGLDTATEILRRG